MEITPLGSGCEVGRSCCIVRFRGATIMFDCGVHPAYSGLASLPYFDEIDLSTVDLLLITHFHMDHCGAVPYFTEKTNFKGRVFMTHPTKAIYKILLHDAAKIGSDDDKMYDEGDLLNSMAKIETINYHQLLQHKGVKFSCYNAGHVLGAAMFQIEVSGVRVLYTGDFSRNEDRHLLGAEAPPEPPHVLIVESTFGVQLHDPQEVRERRFTQKIHEIIKRGGRCLIPVFALGRSQELLLILDEYWREHDGTAFESALQVDPEHGVSPVKLIDMRFIIALGELGGTMVRRQDLPKEAFIDLDTLKRMPHYNTLPIISISHPWQQADHPDPKEVNLQLLAKVMKILGGTFAVFFE